jgi:hypothetical protein
MMRYITNLNGPFLRSLIHFLELNIGHWFRRVSLLKNVDHTIQHDMQDIRQWSERIYN